MSIIVSGAPESLMYAFRKVLGAEAARIGEGQWDKGSLRRWQRDLKKKQPSLAVQVRLGKDAEEKEDLTLAEMYRKAGVKAVFVYNHISAVPEGLPATSAAVAAPALYGLWDREDEDAALPLLRHLQQEALSGRTVPCLPTNEGERSWPLLHAEDLAGAVAAAAEAPLQEMPLLVKGDSTALSDVLEQAAWAAGCRLKDAAPSPLQQMPFKGLETEAEGFLSLSGGASLPLGVGLFHLLQRVSGAPMRVSACWIVKDGAEDLPHSIESVKDAADELIVVDTGSTDNTLKLAARFTHRIYRYPWRDDFAAARNFALSKASGDWIIFLDADEYFLPEGSRALRQVLERAWQSPLPTGLISPMWDVRRGREKEHLSHCVVQRIYRRLPWLRYTGAVHEMLTGLPPGAIALDAPRELTLYHTGYTPEKLADKAQRNEKLLTSEIAAGRPVELQHYYLSGLALQRKDYRTALQEAKASLAAGERAVYHGFAVYHNWYLAAAALGEPTDEVLAAGLAAYPNMPDFHAVRGMDLLAAGKKQEAIGELELAVSLADRHEELLPHEENRLVISGEIRKLYRALYELYEENGDGERAEAWRKRAEDGELPTKNNI